MKNLSLLIAVLCLIACSNSGSLRVSNKFYKPAVYNKELNLKLTSEVKKNDNSKIFIFREGDLYKIYCAPFNITDLKFNAREHIITIAGGDTVRWQVSKAFSGDEALSTRREHLLIKPADMGLHSMLVVTTDQRVYHLMLYANDKFYVPMVSWLYPADNFSEPNNYGLSISLNSLRFIYITHLVKGAYPDWFPEVVFDDENKIYILIPKKSIEAPALFVSGYSGNQTVNYRVAGNYYIVENLFESAQLKTGAGKKEVIVAITKIRASA